MSQLYADKVIDAVAYRQTEVFKAGITFARSDENKTILFNLSGHGHFDMSAYDTYFSGKMLDESV